MVRIKNLLYLKMLPSIEGGGQESLCTHSLYYPSYVAGYHVEDTISHENLLHLGVE